MWNWFGLEIDAADVICDRLNDVDVDDVRDGEIRSGSWIGSHSRDVNECRWGELFIWYDTTIIYSFLQYHIVPNAFEPRARTYIHTYNTSSMNSNFFCYGSLP